MSPYICCFHLLPLCCRLCIASIRADRLTPFGGNVDFLLIALMRLDLLRRRSRGRVGKADWKVSRSFTESDCLNSPPRESTSDSAHVSNLVPVSYRAQTLSVLLGKDS